jgi:hypothetical protein
MASPEDTLRSLGWLGAAEPGLQAAAQIEDMLAEVSERLRAGPESPLTALLILGARPPHPGTAGGQTPACPRRHDWRRLLAELERRPNVAIAAIRDQPDAPGKAEWDRLGSAAFLALDRADAELLGGQLGLLTPDLGRMPIPIAGAVGG